MLSCREIYRQIMRLFTGKCHPLHILNMLLLVISSGKTGQGNAGHQEPRFLLAINNSYMELQKWVEV